jgi:hypothetical protein
MAIGTNLGILAQSSVSIQTEFIMLVKTDNPGTSASDQFTIPTTTGTYNYDVDWGDGNTDTGVTGTITHTFAGGAGTYTVKISGTFPRIYFNGAGGSDAQKLLEIKLRRGAVSEELMWVVCGYFMINILSLAIFDWLEGELKTKLLFFDLEMYEIVYLEGGAR